MLQACNLTKVPVCNDGSRAVKSLFWRWAHRVPSPFTAADLRAGCLTRVAFRHFEVSDTRVFNRPPDGRALFAQVIRDHLDDGRIHLRPAADDVQPVQEAGALGVGREVVDGERPGRVLLPGAEPAD